MKRKASGLNYLSNTQQQPTVPDIITPLVQNDKNESINSYNLEGYTKLHQATLENNLAEVIDLLKKHADPMLAVKITNEEKRLTIGDTILHIAVRNNFTDIIQLITADYRVLLTIKNNLNKLPLHVAAELGKLDTLESLVDSETNFNVKTAKKDTLLHLAVENNSKEIIEYLIKQNANLHVKNGAGKTPLDLAVRNGNLEIIKYLVNEQTPLDKLVSNNKSTILHYAAELESKEVIEYLIQQKLDLNVQDKRGETPLHLAAEYGNIDIIKYLFSHKDLNFNIQNKSGDTPLHKAVLYDNIDVVKYLIEQKADLSILNENNKSPLQYALMCGNFPLEVLQSLYHEGQNLEIIGDYGTVLSAAVHFRNLDMVKYLVSKGAIIDTKTEEDDTPLHFATENRDFDMVEYLVSKGASVDAKNSYDNTPLHLATEGRNFEMVKYLVSKGASVDAKNSDDNTPLDVAIKNGDFKVVEYLSTKEEANLSLTNQEILLHKAAAKGNLDFVKKLVEKNINLNIINTSYKTPLHAAVAGNLEVIKYLVSKGAIIDSHDTYGNTPLHLTSVGFKSQSFSETQNIVRYLIEQKADLQAKNAAADTPLHLAVQNGNKMIMELLIEQKADLNTQNAKGNTPLLGVRKETDIIELLIEKKADLNIQNAKGNTLLHYATEMSDISSIRSLITAKADLYIMNIEGETPIYMAAFSHDLMYHKSVQQLDVIKCLAEGKARLDVVTSAGKTLLHGALQKYSIQSEGIVKYLIENKELLNAKDIYGDTPLHLAANCGNLRALELLVSQKLDLEILNASNLTPLHLAAYRNHPEIVEYLIDAGANTEALNHNIQTPLSLAISRDNLDIVRSLIIAGVKLPVLNGVVTQGIISIYNIYFDIEKIYMNQPLTTEEIKGNYENDNSTNFALKLFISICKKVPYFESYTELKDKLSLYNDNLVINNLVQLINQEITHEENIANELINFIASKILTYTAISGGGNKESEGSPIKAKLTNRESEEILKEIISKKSQIMDNVELNELTHLMLQVAANTTLPNETKVVLETISSNIIKLSNCLLPSSMAQLIKGKVLSEYNQYKSNNLFKSIIELTYTKKQQDDIISKQKQELQELLCKFSGQADELNKTCDELPVQVALPAGNCSLTNDVKLNGVSESNIEDGMYIT